MVFNIVLLSWLTSVEFGQYDNAKDVIMKLARHYVVFCRLLLHFWRRCAWKFYLLKNLVYRSLFSFVSTQIKTAFRTVKGGNKDLALRATDVPDVFK